MWYLVLQDWVLAVPTLCSVEAKGTDKHILYRDHEPTNPSETKENWRKTSLLVFGKSLSDP